MIECLLTLIYFGENQVVCILVVLAGVRIFAVSARLPGTLEHLILPNKVWLVGVVRHMADRREVI